MQGQAESPRAQVENAGMHQMETFGALDELDVALELSERPEMRLYTRYEHGNQPVRVYRDREGRTRYELMTLGGVRKVQVYFSARALMRGIYGHDTHMPFDRYFRIGRYRKAGRGGSGDLLTLLDKGGVTRRTKIVVHAPKEGGELKGTDVVIDKGLEDVLDAIGKENVERGSGLEVSEEVLKEFDKKLEVEIDRLEGLVGIDLGAKSGRGDAIFKADEVRKLLWRGFAGKMLSQGYDPEDVLQEVYRGLLVRNRGKCPWDARKSTFGHYVHMVISCVLTNYHRKQVKRVEKDALSLEVRTSDGDEIGQWGSCGIEHGSDVGDRLALEGLQRYLEGVRGGPEARLGKKILPYVASGYQRGEIAVELGEEPLVVSRALAWIRKQTAKWAKTSGLDGALPLRYRKV